MSTIALFVGTNTAFNVRRATRNIGQMVSDAFTLHLVSTEPGAFDVRDSDTYETFGADFSSNRVGHVRSLHDYLSNNRPDLVMNVTRPSLHGNPVALAAKHFDVPYVYRYSGDAFYYYNVMGGWKKVACFAVRNVLGRVPVELADAHIVLGPVGERRLVERGVSPDTIWQVPTAVDPDRFRGDHERPDALHPDDERKVILFVGRRSRVKGIPTLERVIPDVLEWREDLEFVFVGGGDRTLDLPPEAANHVTIVGRVDPTDMPAYLDAADALVHPSLSEGIPRAVLEALASGIPVVARDVGDLAQATTNLFEDEAALRDALVHLEDLELDPADPFHMDAVRERYVSAFEAILDRTQEGDGHGR